MNNNMSRKAGSGSAGKKYLLSSAAIIFAIFGLTLTAYAAPLANSAKVTGPNTIVITYSVPVNTSFGDYSNLTGQLAGRSLTNLSGNGTNTITLTFSGSAFAADAHGAMSVASTTVATADNSPYTNGDITVTDGQNPQFSTFGVNVSSNSSGANLPKVGDTVTLTFTTNESIAQPLITLDGHALYPSGTGTGPFTLTYTLVSGDPLGAVPFSFNLTDLTGNAVPIQGTLNLTGTSATAAPTTTAPSTTATASTTGPVITQTTPVPDLSATATPVYVFTSTEAGTLNLSGDCKSSQTTATAGINSVTFTALADGAHNNCVITLTDASGLTSNTIFIPAFTVNTSGAAATPTAAAPATLQSDGFKFTKFLQEGMTSNDVLELQQRLAAEGFSPARSPVNSAPSL